VFHWNRDKFPDVAGFVQSYADAGVQLVPNIKPALLVTHPLYAELAAKGWFVATPMATRSCASSGTRWAAMSISPTPMRRRMVARAGDAAIAGYGIRSTWNDNNEYEIWDARAASPVWHTPPRRRRTPGADAADDAASRQAQIAHRPAERPYVGRAAAWRGCSAMRKAGRATISPLEDAALQPEDGAGLALSGVSNTGHDIGGFSGPAPEPELLLRWVQAGIVMPRFSIHSWNSDRTVNEPWMYAQTTPPSWR
jgi:alpha-glucosidase